jgi:Protein of unknown function (DUF2550)
MLLALLIALGVDLIVVVAFAALVIGRKRWVKRQPGAFAGAIRVTNGEIDGLGPKWKHGSGHWVRDVLVWNRAPLLLTNQLIAVNGVSGEHRATDGEVKRLGDDPIVIEFAAESAKIVIATRPEHRALAIGHLKEPAAVAAAPV